MGTIKPCGSEMEAKTLTVIVHGANNLQAKKKSSHKFFVVFGVGDKKYLTKVVEDPSGCPVWNDRIDIVLEDDHQSLVFVVKEKHSTLGRVEVSINGLSEKARKKATTVALQEHKKCPNPVGSLIYEVWVTSKNDQDDQDENSFVEKKKRTPMSILRSKSPNLPKTVYSSLKPLIKDGTSNLRSRIKSVSMTDLSTWSSASPSTPIETPRFSLNRAPKITTDHTKDPVIHTVEPCQGTCMGGTVLTIEGADLGNHSEDIALLEVGGTNCLLSMKYVSSSKLMVTTLPHKPGGVQLTIQTFSGGKTKSREIFEFVNDVPGPNGLRKKSFFTMGDSSKKDDFYVTSLEEEVERLRKENKDLKIINASMLEYIQRLVNRIIFEFPDALAIPEKK